MINVFIDGSVGTTGLGIKQRLSQRRDIALITLSENERKDTEKRKDALNSSDISFLCLPDYAAVEAVSFVTNPNTVIIDASTAHRTKEGWSYGFPELSEEHRAAIVSSKRIANPGCHASGFVALLYPLVSEGILPADARLSCFSLTGYSGGGKSLIAEYQGENRDPLLCAPRQYALGQSHKHLKEMTAVTGLENPPLFCPIVADFYSGMELTIPIFKEQLAEGKSAYDVKAAYAKRYNGDIVFYTGDESENGILSAAAYSGKDSMGISVHGNEDRILLTARFDNLGKGASGAAIECMNIVTGAAAAEGLIL